MSLVFERQCHSPWNFCYCLQWVQESIPVGCVPPALYRMGGGSLWQRVPWTETPWPLDRDTRTETAPGQRSLPRPIPPVDRQTPVKTLPSQTSFAGGKNTGSESRVSCVIWTDINSQCFLILWKLGKLKPWNVSILRHIFLTTIVS